MARRGPADVQPRGAEKLSNRALFQPLPKPGHASLKQSRSFYHAWILDAVDAGYYSGNPENRNASLCQWSAEDGVALDFSVLGQAFSSQWPSLPTFSQYPWGRPQQLNRLGLMRPNTAA